MLRSTVATVTERCEQAKLKQAAETPVLGLKPPYLNQEFGKSRTPRVGMNTARLDISSPALKEAVASVRSDGTADKYCILGYEGKAKIVLKETGTGSMADMVEELSDSEISYVLLRVEGGRDQESKAVKFCYIVYVGPSVGGMAKGRLPGEAVPRPRRRRREAFSPWGVTNSGCRR